MVNNLDSRLSKTINAREREYPLQTRAFFLSSDLMNAPDALDDVLERIAQRGYNTIIVPVLQHGTVMFGSTRTGSLRQTPHCHGRQILTLLRHHPLSVILYFDILTAGEPGGRRLGTLARRNRDWLMRNYLGGYQHLAQPEIPGLFCWTTLNYRRYLCTLVMQILEAYPVDGLMFDLRNLPKTTLNQRSWTHFGLSSLRRIQTELNVDLEELLTQPSMAVFEGVDQWRLSEFAYFIESIRARAQTCRQVPLSIIARLDPDEQLYAPWAESLARGIIDEAIFHADPERVVATAEALDRAAGDERPFLVLAHDEPEAIRLSKTIDKVPAVGMVIEEPDWDSEEPMPDTRVHWGRPEGLEVHPIEAALTLLDEFHRKLDPSDPVIIFFQELEEYLEGGTGRVDFQEVLKVRTVVNEIRKAVEQEEGELKLDRENALRQLDLVARLLLLTPAPPIQAT